MYVFIDKILGHLFLYERDWCGLPMAACQQRHSDPVYSEHLSLGHSLRRTCGFEVRWKRGTYNPGEKQAASEFVSGEICYHHDEAQGCGKWLLLYGECPRRQALQMLLLLTFVHYLWLVTSLTFLTHVCLLQDRKYPSGICLFSS